MRLCNLAMAQWAQALRVYRAQHEFHTRPDHCDQRRLQAEVCLSGLRLQ
jgi:hypothetical protein